MADKNSTGLCDIVFTEDGFIYIPPRAEPEGTEKAFAEAYKADAYDALFALCFADGDGVSVLEDAKFSYLYRLGEEFLAQLSSDYSLQLTRRAEISPSEEISARLLEALPFALGAENVTSGWLDNVWSRLCGRFNAALEKYDGTPAEYINSRKPGQNVMGRVYFHLVENKNDVFPFAFLATYCSRRDGKTVQQPLQYALTEFQGRTDELLKLLPTVLKAADKSEFISEIVESGEIFSPLGLTEREAYRFLCEIPVYNECGILCRIPDWWRSHSRRASVSVTLGEKQPSSLGASALLSFDVSLALDGELLTQQEAEALLSSSTGLAFIKGKWVEADAERLKQTLEAYDTAKKSFGSRGLDFSQAMRLMLGMDMPGLPETEREGVKVSAGEWLRTFTEKMKRPTEELGVSPDFKGTLRPYQLRGYNWLYMMYTLGLGACLSDDMGLGKTVQVIALLQTLKERGGGASLLVIPASLIENWRRELRRFAPDIKFTVLHKSCGGELTEGGGEDLFITTYAMAAKNEQLGLREWNALIIDEAQAIKNPSSKQTRAIKAIPARFLLALTGTPVENRLTDLWSIFDFLNPGMLSGAKEFGNYCKKLREAGDYSRLKKTVSPFILRRLKTDRSIITDLPDKIEMNNYPQLCKKQVVLYKSVVDGLRDKLDGTDGIERKGLVLSSIMKLKQICDHPDLYDGQGAFEAAESGKFGMLAELCETICSKRERLLVFTQFRELCEPLDEFLATVFGERGIVLHGGTEVKKRGELVERFNDTGEYVPYMVLSLKAGGVGLNLTAANHVVHFDRWWNPAVENQATDRAFRIGQTKNVVVHKLITWGTIEEKIDALIESKRQLAGEILPDSGETSLTELPTDELMNMFRLEL